VAVVVHLVMRHSMAARVVAQVQEIQFTALVSQVKETVVATRCMNQMHEAAVVVAREPWVKMDVQVA
jgi:hypothetical protein